MKTSLRRAFNYWIPPRPNHEYGCPICEGFEAWGFSYFGGRFRAQLVHAPECPTQASPVAIADFAKFLLYLHTVLYPERFRSDVFSIVVPGEWL